VKHCGWYPDTKLRIWKNNKGQWAGENPHDEFRLFDKSAKIVHLDGDILHYSYYTEEDHDKQIEYFTSIAAEAHVKNGKGTYLLKPPLSAFMKFIKCLFIKAGFLDGRAGWRISVKSAYAAYLKYKKIGQLIKKNKS
jgi:hypothetical protein